MLRLFVNCCWIHIFLQFFVNCRKTCFVWMTDFGLFCNFSWIADKLDWLWVPLANDIIFLWINEKPDWFWEPDLACDAIFCEFLKNLIDFKWQAWFGLWCNFSWIVDKPDCCYWFRHLAIIVNCWKIWLVLRAWFWPFFFALYFVITYV